MPQFAYTAMDQYGKEQKGTLEASSEDVAASTLKKQGLYPTSLKALTAKGQPVKRRRKAQQGSIFNFALGARKIKRKELTLVTRQLATLLEAGLPLIRSLRTLEKQSKNAMTKLILGDTADAVEEGATFSEALAYNPKSFDKLYLNMVRAGEAAGAMETILSRLAQFMEKAAKIAGKVKSAMIYPISVLVIAGLITTGLMIWIVPSFKSIFDDLLPGSQMPALTLWVIDASNVLVHEGWKVLLAIVAIIILYCITNRTKYGKFGIDWVKYHMPLFGPIISRSAIARFSRTLGTLMAAGVPVLNALNIVRDTSGNDLVASAVQKVHDAVKEGEGIAAPLNATGIFPQMVISMIEVGEETGRLPDMLERIADKYEDEVDNAVNALTSMIEPLMIVVLAVIVGTIVIAMFLPLTKLIEGMG